MGNTSSAQTPQTPAEQSENAIEAMHPHRLRQPPSLPIRAKVKQTTDAGPQDDTDVQIETQSERSIESDYDIISPVDEAELGSTPVTDLGSTSADNKPIEDENLEDSAFHPNETEILEADLEKIGKAYWLTQQEITRLEDAERRQKHLEKCIQSIRRVTRRLVESERFATRYRLLVLRRNVTKVHHLIRKTEEALHAMNINPASHESYVSAKFHLDMAMEEYVYKYERKLIPKINRWVWLRHNLHKMRDEGDENDVDGQSYPVPMSVDGYEPFEDEL